MIRERVRRDDIERVRRDDARQRVHPCRRGEAWDPSSGWAKPWQGSSRSVTERGVVSAYARGRVV